LQTIERGSKTLICISFTKLNIHLLLERVFLNFSGYSLTVTQMQVNATKRLHKFRNRSHFSRDAKRSYEKTYYSHTLSVVSTVTQPHKGVLYASVNIIFLFTINVGTRIEIVKLYYSLGESATAALPSYKTKHGLIIDPFIVSTITRLIAQFESTGSVLDFPGKGRKSLSDERAPIVQNAVEQLQSQSIMASSSITQVSQLTGIPRASVRVYHENKPKNLVELTARIEEECARVTLEEVKHAVSHISYRLRGALAMNLAEFESPWRSATPST
ncbi:hypothetical protein CSKR_113840, partial [Clonorchis sinensis]